MARSDQSSASLKPQTSRSGDQMWFFQLCHPCCAFLACNALGPLLASGVSTSRSSSDVIFSVSAPWMSSRQHSHPQLWTPLAGKRAMSTSPRRLLDRHQIGSVRSQAPCSVGCPLWAQSLRSELAHSRYLVNVDSEGSASFPGFKKSTPSK